MDKPFIKRMLALRGKKTGKKWLEIAEVLSTLG